jgi:uncharacterized protein (TIGR03000 family)
MYSVILMTAMTTVAPEAPQFGWRHGCTGGCYGCSGSCYGYASGCRGGCYGGGCHGGCYGGCHGYYSGGCGGGCCGGYYSGGSGNYYYSAAPVGVVDDYAGPVLRVYGPAVWGANYYYSGSTPFLPVSPPDQPIKPELDKKLGGAARLILDVATDATVKVDGQLTTRTSETRLFYTPKLEEGQAYYYDVEVAIPGEKPETRRVYVHANEVVRESFKKSTDAGVASK